MSTPAKYMFDLPLDGPSTPPPVPHEDVEAMKLAHATELEKVRQEALEQGRQQGRDEAMQGIDTQLSTQLEQVMHSRDKLQTDVNTALQQIRTLSLRLAMESAEKLAGDLVRSQPDERLEQFFKNCLALLPTKTDLRMHVAPELAEGLQVKLEVMMSRAGQQNTLTIYPDEEVSGADCRILWTDGGIEQNWQAMRDQIDQIVSAYLQAEQNAAIIQMDATDEQ